MVRVSVNYGWKTFGNGRSPWAYKATVSVQGECASLRFRFDPPVKGIGREYQDSKATVSSASLHLPLVHARALAEAILKLAEAGEDGSATFEFGKGGQ